MLNRCYRGYDIIGDVHGCYNSLVELLELLGYRLQGGVYRHPERQVVFLGDLVDRGPQIRETLHLVRDMVAAGAATLVLGNHEINLLGFHTPASPQSERSYLRERSERHQSQLNETLQQFDSYSGELRAFLDWMLELPLFMEFEHFRVAHACWDQALIRAYRERHRTDCLSAHIFQASEDWSGLEHRTIDRLTRGTSLLLPDNAVMVGSDGLSRRYFRTKFWLASPQTYGELPLQPDALPQEVYHQRLTEKDYERLLHYAAHEPPLFVGHYWMSGSPQLMQPNIACLDYSAVHGGRLMAYRWSGPGRLSADNLVWVNVSDALH